MAWIAFFEWYLSQKHEWHIWFWESILLMLFAFACLLTHVLIAMSFWSEWGSSKVSPVSVGPFTNESRSKGKAKMSSVALPIVSCCAVNLFPSVACSCQRLRLQLEQAYEDLAEREQRVDELESQLKQMHKVFVIFSLDANHVWL